MRYSLLTLYIAIVLVVFPAAAQTPAQQDAQFFTAIADMPLMPGLIELPDQTVMFDKPEGRIIESVAEIESVSEEDVSKYYNTTLPQLGWSRIAENTYTREGEQLNLKFETLQRHRFFRITVTPQGGDSTGAL
jgi:hypothetical protein